MASPFDAELEDRLVRYAAIDSQSDETSDSTPSTDIQYDMLNLLAEELRAMGAADVEVAPYGTVLATVPATVSEDLPTVAFLAHVDTAPAYHAEGVKPRVHKAYDGSPIRFPEAPDLVLSPDTNPYLGEKIGDDIITASGATLLGADDKAGVAIIMTAARHMLENPDIPHGPVRLAFTPDEEIGRGVMPNLPPDLKADFAYTFDGSKVGELVYESFSADGAAVKVTGVSTHTGTAKGKMVNALHLAAKIIDAIPQDTMTPEVTDGRDGFIHVYRIDGTAAEVEVHMILRDFELADLEAKGALLTKICQDIQAAEPRAQITCDIRPQYRNMRYWLENDMTPVELARDAYEALGIKPFSKPIRGGTDGSRLTEFGVPTPNLFTGMQDIHGPLEWISVQDMALATQVCLEICKRVPPKT